MSAPIIDNSINEIVRNELGSDDYIICEIVFQFKRKLLGDVISKSTTFSIFKRNKFLAIRIERGGHYHRGMNLIVPNNVCYKDYVEEYKSLVSSPGILLIQCYSSGDGWVDLSQYKSDKFLKHSTPLVDIWGKRINKMSKINKNGGNININLLLHGIPGSGKSRFAALLAAKTGKTLRILNIKDKKSLQSTLKCVYLIEEIDKLLMPNGDFISDGALNVDTVLQFLDGALRPRNSVIIITCNDLSRVESNEVLSRKGRITEKIEFSYICEYQCKSVCNTYYEGSDYLQLWDKIKTLNVTIAELSTYVGNCVISDISFDDMVSGFESEKSKKKKTSSMYY